MHGGLWPVIGFRARTLRNMLAVPHLLCGPEKHNKKVAQELLKWKKILNFFIFLNQIK